jgi:hypothetical protein
MALLSQHIAHVRPSMFGRASALIFTVLLAAPFAASCSAGIGENAGSCMGAEDSDGDGLSGCADSDCHRFELCRNASMLAPDPGETGGSGGQGGNAGITPVGGSGGSMVSGGRGGTSGHEDDGGTDHDAGTCACSSGTVCVDGGCVPIEAPEPVFTVQMVSAQSPRGTFGPPPDGVCVEIACRSGGGSPVSYCPCEPELYVRVIHISQPTQPDPGEEIVLSTQTQGETLMVTFGPDDKADVALEPGDKLRFELWDQNMTVADAMIDSCEPDLHELTSGPIDCSYVSGPTGLEVFWIRATLEKH